MYTASESVELHCTVTSIHIGTAHRFGLLQVDDECVVFFFHFLSYVETLFHLEIRDNIITFAF